MKVPDYESIALAIDGPVVTVTLNRPEQMNAWDWQMHRELRHAYALLDADDEVRAIVLTGAGQRFAPARRLLRRGRLLTDRKIDQRGTSATRARSVTRPNS